MSDEREREPSWRLLSEADVHENRIFRVQRRVMVRPRAPERPAGDFFVIHCGSWVNVIALARDDRLVLVEQWRHAVEHVTLEIPGGCIDPGETPFEAARRELLEETGYGADRWFELGSVEPNPAIHANLCHTFLALDAEPRGAQHLDPNEDCRVVLLSFDDVERRTAEGEVQHALVVAALHFERLRRAGRLTARPVP